MSPPLEGRWESVPIIVVKQLCKFHSKNLQTPLVETWRWKGGTCNIIIERYSSFCLADAFAHQSLPAFGPLSTINHVSHMRNCCVIVAKQLCKFHCKNLQTPLVGRWLSRSAISNIMRSMSERLFSWCLYTLITPSPRHHVSLQVAPTILNHVLEIGRLMKKCCIIVAKHLCEVYSKNLQTQLLGRWSCKWGFCNIIRVDLSVCLVDAFAHQSIPLSGPPSPIHYVSLQRVGFPSLRISPCLPNIIERWLKLWGPRYLWAISLTRFSGYIILR